MTLNEHNEVITTGPQPLPFGMMLDIETVDTASTAAILEIAFVPFLLSNPLAQYPGQLVRLSLQPQLDMGRTLSASTLKFWLEQSHEGQLPLRAALTDGTREDIRDSLESLAIWLKAWVGNTASIELWAKGAGFDSKLVQGLFQQFAVDWPFDFRADRDLRTLLAIAGVSSKDIARMPGEVAHSALGDARYQIRQYNLAMGRLDIDAG